MRKVFSNSMVAHVWAQQNQEEGRSGNGNLFFRGPTLYSYSDSYPIAHFTDREANGRRVILFQENTYSISTARHIRLARMVLGGLNVVTIRVPWPTPAYGSFRHDDNIAWMVKRFDSFASDLAKVNKRCYLCGGADSAANRIAGIQVPNNLTMYCEAFGLAIPDLQLEAKRQAVHEAFARHNDPKRVRARARAQSKRELKYASQMAMFYAWREGVAPRPATEGLHLSAKDVVRLDTHHRDRWGRDKFPGSPSGPKVSPEAWIAGEGSMTSLRSSYWDTPTGITTTFVRRNGDRLETSLGAEVPWAHAVAVFRMAQRCRKSSTIWQRNGDRQRIGVFELDGIDAEGNIRAGCHRIMWAEMLRLAVRECPEVVEPTAPLPVPVS